MRNLKNFPTLKSAKSLWLCCWRFCAGDWLGSRWVVGESVEFALEEGEEGKKLCEEVFVLFCWCDRGNPFKQRSVVRARRTPEMLIKKEIFFEKKN